MEKLPESIVEAINSLKKPLSPLSTVLSGQSPAGGSNENAPLFIHTSKYPKIPDTTGISFLEKVNNRANITAKLAVSMWSSGNYAHLEEAIKRTSRCTLSRIVENEQTVKTWMCGKRWCSNCVNVQAGILIKRFLPVYNELSDLYFVTLTTTSPSDYNLGNHIKTMNKVFSSIHRNIKEYQKLPFDAIRKLEYTDGTIEGRIHPHFHIIVNGKRQAEELRAQWFTRMTKLGVYVHALGQDVRQCDENGLFEVLKYVHKSLKEETHETKEGKKIKTGNYFVDGWKVNEAWKQITNMKFRLLSTYGKFYGIKTDLTEQEIKEEIKSNPLNGIEDGTYIRQRGKLIHIQSGEIIIKPNFRQKVYDTRMKREITFTDVSILQRILLKEELNEQTVPRWTPNEPTTPPE